MFSKIKTIFFLILIFLIFPIFILADYEGQRVGFFVDSGYDSLQRERITARLEKIGKQCYFYVDEQWWKDLSYQDRLEMKASFEELDNEFFNKIYPVLRSTFGSEKKPGIDNDHKVTILFHMMKEDAGGYFSEADEYSTMEAINSNKREMVYLNTDNINSSLIKSYLAHEFVHLITFNQKDEIHNVSEDIWLNEARAEYAPTLLGYDNEEGDTNLDSRASFFLKDPFDSLTEWSNDIYDYGVLNIFTQYLVEHYGIEILIDSLYLEKTGISSINQALIDNGFEKDFSDIFTDWTVAVLVNDCSLGEEYCYKNENLKDLKILPSINFLPLYGKSNLGLNQKTKNWAGNWSRFIGGQKEADLKIKFIGNPENLFKIPYIIEDVNGEYSINFFELSEYQRGEILIPNFGSMISSLTIIPSVQSQMSGFVFPETEVPFFWEASTILALKEGEEEEEEEENNLFLDYLGKPIKDMIEEELLIKISETKDLLAILESSLARLKEIASFEAKDNLYFGLKNDDRVKDLQEFLKSQGKEIYPEGLITGNFLTLTREAVIRFQEKYSSEILFPLNLVSGTGFVGPSTLKKINFLYKK